LTRGVAGNTSRTSIGAYSLAEIGVNTADAVKFRRIGSLPWPRLEAAIQA